MEEWGEKACLNVPLIVEGERLGLLVLIETTRERVFGPAEVELARALGELAAIAIRHARLYRRGELQNRRLVALLETSRVLVSSLDVDAVLGQVRRDVAGLFAVAGAAVTPAAAARRGVRSLRRPVRRPRPPARRRRRRWNWTSCAAAPSTDLAPALAEDSAASVWWSRSSREAPRRACSTSAAPEGLVFGDDELELLQVLASQAAAALANAALYRTLERQAITDGLTGLYNHRYFYERLNQEIARAQRYGLPLSLLMIDIDDFKHFNDRYGHPTGDLVLTEVGRILGHAHPRRDRPRRALRRRGVHHRAAQHRPGRRPGGGHAPRAPAVARCPSRPRRTRRAPSA